MSKKLRGIIIFFILAFGLTFLANQLPPLAIGVLNINLILLGFGPLVSALICYRLLKTENVIGVSLLGTRPVFSVVVCIVPLVTVCLTQTKNELTVILIYLLMQLVYCFGEEFGWRHYLQNATHFMNEWLQSFLIGLLWFAWHYSFLDDLQAQLLGADLPDLIFVPMMIVLLSLLSFVFGLMVKRSKSILFPAVGHFLFKTGPLSMVITGVLMAVILIFWNKLSFRKREEFA